MAKRIVLVQPQRGTVLASDSGMIDADDLDADEIRENARRLDEWEEKRPVEELMGMSRLIKQTIPSILVELLPDNVLLARYQDNHMISWRIEKIPGGWKVEQHQVTTSFTFNPVEEIKHIKVFDR